jgi:hypothetical protein
MSQKARFEWPVTMDRHGEPDGAAVLAVDVVAAVNAKLQPAVPLECFGQIAAGRRLHMAMSMTRSCAPVLT